MSDRDVIELLAETRNWLREVGIGDAAPAIDAGIVEIARLRGEVALLSRPATWQDECAAVEAAFEQSGVEPTWPEDEPGSIGPMAAAMADEIARLRAEVERLRLTEAEREELESAMDIAGAVGRTALKGALRALLARLGGGA